MDNFDYKQFLLEGKLHEAELRPLSDEQLESVAQSIAFALTSDDELDLQYIVTPNSVENNTPRGGGFDLDTEGTLYTDYDESIKYNEFGVYAQMQKDLFDDNLSLTASMRYDKQDVMEDANITPRLGLLYKLSDKYKGF